MEAKITAQFYAWDKSLSSLLRGLYSYTLGILGRVLKIKTRP